MPPTTRKELQQKINATLWAACDTFRGVVDPAEYKNYILVFLFLKYLSDVWKDKLEQYRKQYGGDEERVQRKMQREPFVLPGNATFDYIVSKKQDEQIGQVIKTPASVADRIAYRRKRECRERLEEDPVLYKKFSQLIQQAIDDFQSKRISEAEYLKRMREIDKDFQHKTTAGTPESLSGRPTAAAFFRILQEEFQGSGHEAKPEALAKASIDIVEALRPLAIRDWKQNTDVHKQMEDAIDDYLYDFSRERGFRINTNILLRIFDRLIHTARYHEWR